MTKISPIGRFPSARWPLALLVAAGVAVAASFFSAHLACDAAADASASMVAEFTGQFEGIAPVYRLPTISVSANREVAVVDARARKPEQPAPDARRRSPS